MTWMSNVYARFVVDTQPKNQKKSWRDSVEFCACNCGSKNLENFEEHIRHILFYYFKKEKKATEARKKLRWVYGRNVVKKRQCQNWFTRFRNGDFSVKDAHRSGRPSKIDDDEMKALVQANKHLTVRELATALKVSVGSVHDHLKSLGFVKKLDVWVPHELKEIHLTNERLRSIHQTRRKWSVLEAYDHGRWKMDCLQQCRKRSWNRRDEAPER